MKTVSTPSANFRFVTLESNIPYDWDDYDAWGSVLYDIEKDAIVTVKYGHGSGMSMGDGVISLQEAVEQGSLNIAHLIDVMVASLGIGFGNANVPVIAEKYSIEKPFGIPVNVTGGRKFKGNGYLVCSVSEPVRYGLCAYHNEKVHKYIIYSPEKNDYFTVNSFSYLEISDEVKEAWNKKIREGIKNTIEEVKNLAHAWAYNMSYSACDTRNYYSLIAQYSGIGSSAMEPAEILLKAAAEYTERKAKEEEEKMMAELPKIIEWVKANTDKTTEEDIINLAKHIWRKYNK